MRVFFIVFSAFISGIFVLYHYFKWKYRRSAEPIGPEGLVDTLKFFRSVPANGSLAEALHQAAEKFGNICSIRLYRRRWFILASHDLARHAFFKREISKRPFHFGHDAHDIGIIGANGSVWKIHRRFALATLRDFGMGKSGLEKQIQEEALLLIQKMAETETLDPEKLLSCATCNVISFAIFNKRFDYDNAKFLAFNKGVTEILGTPLLSVLQLVPVLTYLPYFRGRHREIQASQRLMRDVVTDLVEEHENTYREGEIRDYLDAFLQQQYAGEKTFTKDQLVASAIDLFAGGTETTSNTLYWAIFFLAKNPQLQEKIHQEIVETIGPHTLPTMFDKSKLTLLEAFILEVHRRACIFPAIAHEACEDTSIGNYPVLAGDTVFVSVRRLLNSPKLWPFPAEFNVGNFLQDGQIVNRDYCTPFMFGRRSCIGESLARMELFIFLVIFLQSFQFSFPDGQGPDESKLRAGLIRKAPLYRVHVALRRGSRR